MKSDAGDKYVPVKPPNNVVRKITLTIINVILKWNIARLSQNYVQVTQVAPQKKQGPWTLDKNLDGKKLSL